jgi:hypothetical protein
MFKVEINEEQFEEALLRHEEAFDKELEEIKTDEKELRKMILKMKKAIIEQSRQNNSTYQHTVNAIEELRAMYRQMQKFESEMKELGEKVDNCTEVFSKAIGVIRQYESNKKKEKGFFKGLWEFIKQLWKN